MNKNERQRAFNLVINKNAKCYGEVKQIIENLCNLALYGLILHDKDTTEEGQIKEPHYHLFLKFKNARTFQSLSKQFEGAHIESVLNENQSIKYLMHQTTAAKAQGKYQYSINELLTNDITKIQEVLKEEDYHTFIVEDVPKYIANGILHPYSFARYFGPNSTKTNRGMYKEIVASYLNRDDNLLVEEVDQIKKELKQQEEQEEQELTDEELPF